MSESVARTFLYIECQNLVTKESEQTNSCVVLHSLGLNLYCLKKKVSVVSCHRTNEIF